MTDRQIDLVADVAIGASASGTVAVLAGILVAGTHPGELGTLGLLAIGGAIGVGLATIGAVLRLLRG